MAAKNRGAVRFDGATTNYVKRLSSVPSPTNFTVTFWVKRAGANPGATQEYPFAIEDGDSSAPNIIVFGRYTSTTWAVVNSLGVFSDFTTTGTIVDGEWYFAAVSCSGTGAGQFAGYCGRVGRTLEKVTQTGLAFTPARLSFGNTSYDVTPLNGSMAAIKLWDRVLTDSEIETERQCVVPVSARQLNSWFPFRNFNDATYDFSQNGRHATRGGTTITSDWGPPIPWQLGSTRIWIPSALVGTNVTVAMTTNSASFSTPSPSVLYDFVVALSAQSAAFSQPALSVVTDQILSLSPQVAIFSQPAPTVAIGTDVTAGVNSAAFTNPSPQVITDAILAINPATAQFTVISPTVIAGGDISVELAAQVAQFSQGLGQVVTDSTIVISPVTATFTPNSPEVIITIPSTATISRVSIWIAIR